MTTVMSEDDLLQRFLHLEPEGQVLQLWSLFEAGNLSVDVAHVMVTRVWQQPNFPMPLLGADKWAALFNLAGYTEDGVSAERPVTELTLYRGSLAEHREGFAWTELVQMAEKFARPRFDGHVQADVWTASVPPERLFARISAEREYVLDARGLTIVRVPRHDEPRASKSDSPMPPESTEGLTG
jgi:hypothetical protein